MTKVRCEKCGRLLCEVDSKVRIKCRKCGHINYIEVKEADQASQSKK
ncbi:Com family DNA-binding transcriptional regulator [Maledivibacter halophilus]|uniref:Mu-like prophage protein Com n=1 Tax=Maledivibacter halophilus TaxID=36842 RepID=A0A1T5M557_9FIRM|nr:Com family DNA-binding transcriptional regulator [Maledivibacter halophilus]SKC82999.1 Mu-like prophage protein Com [Maledivibacter halophilus]